MIELFTLLDEVSGTFHPEICYGHGVCLWQHKKFTSLFWYKQSSRDLKRIVYMGENVSLFLGDKLPNRKWYLKIDQKETLGPEKLLRKFLV